MIGKVESLLGWRFGLRCLGCAVVLLAIAFAAGAGPGYNYLVSISTSGDAGNASSYGARVSPDGRFVAFSSRSDNLVPNDANGADDVFLRDTLARTTERISVSSAGEEGNAGSWADSISGDGRFVAFSSYASNLVPEDTNDTADVFVGDRLTGTTERVSVSSTGEQGNASSAGASISADGRFVAFASYATNLVPNDTNGTRDVFIRDMLMGTTRRVSVSTSGEQGDGTSGIHSMSADARYVAFDSLAANLVADDTNGVRDIFLHDCQTGETSRVSVASDGSQADGSSRSPAVCANGRHVAFLSESGNLAPGASARSWRVYVRDVDAGQTILIGDWEYWGSPAISGDGRYVAFNSYCTGPSMDGAIPEARCFHVYDTATSEYAISGFWCAQNPSLSADGRYLAYEDAWCYLCYWSGSDYDCYTPPGPDHVWLYDRFPDQVPPDTQIVSGPCGQMVCPGEASICFNGSDNDTPAEFLQYLWRVDGGAWRGPTADTCTSPTRLGDGQHLFQVKARDQAGNEDPTPAQCSFTVDAAPPNVSITSPANGATVKGIVSISASASDASGVQRVEFYVRGQLLCTDPTAPYSCEWDTRPLSVAEGPAEICARALDSCGHASQYCMIVNVDNTTFDDVAKTDSIWRYVEALVARGITSGCSSSPSL